MERVLRLTEDGTHTLYVSELDEPYHSIHGALQESRHVFIEQGFRMVQKSPLYILEIGLGTGLNLILSLIESDSDGTEVFYHAVEKYPLVYTEYNRLNYEKIIPGIPEGSFMRMHEAPWEEDFQLTKNFRIHKERSDFRSMKPAKAFDLVYFDAFAPVKQPYLWTAEVFSMLYAMMVPGAILVSYTSKGDVRRALISCGFEVIKVPGPAGKREMIRAIKR